MATLPQPHATAAPRREPAPRGVELTSTSLELLDGTDGWIYSDLLEAPCKPGQLLRLEVTAPTVLSGWRYSPDTYPAGYAQFWGKPQPSCDFLFRIYFF